MPQLSDITIKSAPPDEECVKPRFEDGVYGNPWKGVPDHPNLTRRPLGRGGKHVPYTDDELQWLNPVLEPIFRHDTDDEGVLRATWLGHSSVWVNMEGVSMLFDPVLVDAIEQPTDALNEIHRLRPPPCMVEELPQLHAVFISHNHTGHLDVQTCEKIVFHFGQIPFFVPAGLGAFVREAVGAENVVEMSWWEEASAPLLDHRPDQLLRVVCLPCQHWSMRSEDDINKSLWASWAVVGKEYKVFHCGDTGYCDAFKTIGKRFGGFDLSLIPIGGYVPRDQVRAWHVNPEEAMKMHRDLKSKQSIGIHWGTWFYGLGKAEHYQEPRTMIRVEGEKIGLTDEYRRVVDFITLWLGQTWTSELHGLEGCLLSDPIGS